MAIKASVYNEYTIASFLYKELGYWTECNNVRIVTRLPQLLISGRNGKDYKITVEVANMCDEDVIMMENEHQDSCFK